VIDADSGVKEMTMARTDSPGLQIGRWERDEAPSSSQLSNQLRGEGLLICDVSLPGGYHSPFQPAGRRETVWLIAGWMRIHTRAPGQADARVFFLRPGDRADLAAGERALEVVGEDPAHFIHGL
jgi:hypothetical protein